jgi:hypothetical protein
MLQRPVVCTNARHNIDRVHAASQRNLNTKKEPAQEMPSSKPDIQRMISRRSIEAFSKTRYNQLCLPVELHPGWHRKLAAGKFDVPIPTKRIGLQSCRDKSCGQRIREQFPFSPESTETTEKQTKRTSKFYCAAAAHHRPIIFHQKPPTPSQMMMFTTEITNP